MKQQKWTCDSNAIYAYYSDHGYVPHDLDDGIVIWIKIEKEIK